MQLQLCDLAIPLTLVDFDMTMLVVAAVFPFHLLVPPCTIALARALTRSSSVSYTSSS